MPLDLASEVWAEVKRYINTVDRADATETLVNVLIDNGYDSGDIRDAFKGDSDVKRVLAAYMDDTEEDDPDDEALEDDEEY